MGKRLELYWKLSMLIKFFVIIRKKLVKKMAVGLEFVKQVDKDWRKYVRIEIIEFLLK